MRLLLATIGHSIVRHINGAWVPSPLYQEVTWTGGEEDPRPVRTHILNPLLDPNSPHAYLGGGEAVVEALFQLWNTEHCGADVAFIGGIPLSMDRFGAGVAGISEASVMNDRFQALARLWAKTISFKRRIIGGTRNTADDAQRLRDLSREYDQVLVVAMGFRLPRLCLLLGHTAGKVICRDAEQFLPDRIGEFTRMNQSKAYAATMSQEWHDVNKLLAAKH